MANQYTSGRTKPPVLTDRFWSMVEMSKDGCWLWKRAKTKNGYGNFTVKKGQWLAAHRMSYVLVFGEIPKGFQVCHRCDVRACVRPDHLFLGTQADNMKDMRKKGRWRYAARDQSGERNPNALLTDAVMDQMLKEVNERGSLSAIAYKYGIKYKTLWAMRKRKTEACCT